MTGKLESGYELHRERMGVTEPKTFTNLGLCLLVIGVSFLLVVAFILWLGHIFL